MYLDQLDRLDQKILTLLIENARYSYSEIGERIGISRVAVKARIDALEKKGVLLKSIPRLLNPQKISGAVSCYFEIEAEPARLQEIEERLCRNETITQIYRMSGNCCLHVHAVAASQEELESLLREIDGLPGVVRVSSRVILSRVKDVKGLRL